MHVSAKSDYALRALLTLAANASGPVTLDRLAEEQELPRKYLEAILGDLRRAGIVRAQRGAEGGYSLARPAADVVVADVLRAVDGPLAEVRGQRPEHTAYTGAATHLQPVWIALRASVRDVLDRVSLQDIVTGRLPRHVARMAADPDAWLPPPSAAARTGGRRAGR